MTGRWSVSTAVHSFERDPAEAGDQWFPASVAFHLDLEHRLRPGGRGDGRLVAASHLGHRAAVFPSQRLEHGSLHDPSQTLQAEHVLSEQVVLNQTGILGTVEPVHRLSQAEYIADFTGRVDLEMTISPVQVCGCPTR